MSGAAPLSGELSQAFNRIHPHISLTQGYGMTETSPVISELLAVRPTARADSSYYD